MFERYSARQRSRDLQYATQQGSIITVLDATMKASRRKSIPTLSNCRCNWKIRTILAIITLKRSYQCTLGYIYCLLLIERSFFFISDIAVLTFGRSMVVTIPARMQYRRVRFRPSRVSSKVRSRTGYNSLYLTLSDRKLIYNRQNYVSN